MKVKDIVIVIVYLLFLNSCDSVESQDITPNEFSGSDIERIQAAVDSAQGTTNKMVIPKRNSNGSNIWKIDHAILLPSNMTVILDNTTIQLSDKSRDNMFRSNNVGVGITDPKWNENISIIGIGDVLLKGANNPRATGDGAKTLLSSPKEFGYSYGSDAGKDGVKQTGDWRNIMILMAYVDGFKLKNISIEESHSWAISFERTKNADISDIRFNNNEEILVDGELVQTSNKDGINLRHGCKNFRIDNISGQTGDDFIALSSLDTSPNNHTNGDLNSGMVTTRKYRGPADDTEQIYITNINAKTRYRGIAIRASDSASIHHVDIDGLIARKKEERLRNAILLGGKGYGEPSMPGKINNIHGMNIMSNGRSLAEIEAPVANCTFMNGIYNGEGDDIITYNIEQDKINNLILKNMIKAQE